MACKSVATDEKHKIVAIGGQACLKNEHCLRPFISIHRADDERFSILTTLSFDYLEDSINNLEFLLLPKKPTLLATDSSKLMLMEYGNQALAVIQIIRLHDADINCLAFHRADIYTGSDDKSVAKVMLHQKYAVFKN